MKILTCNAGYLLGYQNIFMGYVPPPVASVVGDSKIEQQKLEELAALIRREQPDVVSLLEVDQGSHRTCTSGQCRTLLDVLESQGLSYRSEVANKYGNGGLVDSLPFFGHLGNAVLTQAVEGTETHYLSAGQKRLVLEVELDPTTVLFVVHLSLGARSRRKQLTQLTSLLAERADGRDVIVTGDFNTFDQANELDTFSDRAGLELRIPGETIPPRPLDSLLLESRSLDLFFCSPSIDIERCTVLDDQISDHRPIVLETAT
ncbi:endonuclease/exonuclease/phosphatase family protein [Natrialbaceae archaeon A-CW2]